MFERRLQWYPDEITGNPMMIGYELPRGGHLRHNNCGATISLAIVLAPQLFLNDCADACPASILANLSAIVQVQFKYDYE